MTEKPFIRESENVTLTDIIRLMDKGSDCEKRTRSMLSRFLDDPETAALLGASGPVRPTFPPSAAPVMAALLSASERGEVTPKMGAVWLAKHFPAISLEAVSRFSENADIREIEKHEPMSSQTLLRLTQTMEGFIAAVQDISSVREDVAITRTQAAALLACAPSSVPRFVRPLRRGIYRRSDCLRYIASGQPQISATANK
ncbi:MAG: hypothetical protein ACRYFS_20755 [Janthinobacterium lividum]